jgi:hypothetical protein
MKKTAASGPDLTRAKSSGLFLVRGQNRRRWLIRIIHNDRSVFFQLAQPFFFLLLFLCQVFLALFVLVVRLCQFVTLPAARLYYRNSNTEYTAKAPACNGAFFVQPEMASSESAAYRQVSLRRRATRAPVRQAAHSDGRRWPGNAWRADR